MKQINPSAEGLREKMRTAQIELKKSKRKDLYKVLGLQQEGADEQKIKTAYRKMAIKWHPDKHSNDSEAE